MLAMEQGGLVCEIGECISSVFKALRCTGAAVNQEM
jgi:hypothetical protein